MNVTSSLISVRKSVGISPLNYASGSQALADNNLSIFGTKLIQTKTSEMFLIWLWILCLLKSENEVRREAVSETVYNLRYRLRPRVRSLYIMGHLE